MDGLPYGPKTGSHHTDRLCYKLDTIAIESTELKRVPTTRFSCCEGRTDKQYTTSVQVSISLALQ